MQSDHLNTIQALQSADCPETRLATRLAFLAAGFGMGCWAPLVPFVKMRLHFNDAQIGLLLLAIGFGSVVAMPLAAALGTRVGTRPVILAGGAGMALVLPLIALAGSPTLCAAMLFLFGGALGAIDIAMNTHAIDVEEAAGRHLMSGFHAMFSVGGFAGAGGITFLLSAGVHPVPASLAAMVVTLAILVPTAPRLLRRRQAEGGAMFALPKGIVLLLAGLAAVAFLMEGTVLDWGALLITETGLGTAAQAGLGYMLFSVAMTAGRFVGDAVIIKIGRRNTMIGSSLMALCGFVVLLASPIHSVALGGFVLIGLGGANVIPILFGAAGRQSVMPTGLALAAVTSFAYAAFIAGPALVGFTAHLLGIRTAFWILATLVVSIAIFAGRACPDDRIAAR